MKKFLIFLVLFFLFNLIFAQRQNNIWYFGNQAGLDFNSGTPIELTNNAMHALEGCASISDIYGNILFYSNGEKVWDKSHMIMPNGDSLGGNQSATQGALILPYPDHDGKYFLFTLERKNQMPPFNSKFSYSIIDMSLNGGKGDVILKNNVVKFPITEKMACVRHANERDIWVMVQGYDNDSLFAYLVTPSGISSNPIMSNTGKIITGDNSLGYMKFSPDGRKLAYACYTDNYVGLFDFDNSTGLVTNSKYLLTLPLPYWNGRGVYGLEFSKNGKYLYATQNRHPNVFQWAINSNSISVINNSLQSVGTIQGNYNNGALQLGPDGKIYLSKENSQYLGVINNPDLPGTLANYVDSGVAISRSCLFGLPNYISSDFLTAKVKNIDNNLTISVFPNPFTDIISIKFHNENIQKANIQIKNNMGQTVIKNQEIYFSNFFINMLDLKSLSKGIYMLEVFLNGEYTFKKIVKD
jgi:hypothetical protein